MKYCRNSNLSPLDEFFRLTSFLYDATKPKINENVDDEILTNTSEPESEAESENEFGFL